MPQIAKFNQLLSGLEQKMEALAALAASPTPPTGDVLAATRWAIVRTLGEIGAFQERYLLAPSEASGDPDIVAQGKALDAAMQTAVGRLIEHSARWSAQEVRDDWAGFCRALPTAHRIIGDHFAWEKRVVPPMLAALEGASATPKRHWTAPIWGIHDSFSDS